MHFRNHLLLTYLIRLMIIILGDLHDNFFKVPFTDIDYKVFSDAAAYVLKSKSPYDRETYRYSPLLAYLLTTNITISPLFGKVIFSFCDCLIAILIKRILKFKTKDERKLAALFWLYNPISVIISTRGNCDSIIGLAVLYTLYNLEITKNYILAGICYGFCIHFRIYPVIYFLAIFLYLKNSFTQLSKFLAGFILSISSLTLIFYHLYGYKFLYETYLYHIDRIDTKHNFSIYFYLEYLNEINGNNYQSILKILKLLPKLILLIYISYKYSNNAKSLNFGLLLQTYVFVIFNSVITSQYFIWILVLLPLNLSSICSMSKSLIITSTASWAVTKVSWLLPAYLVEYRGIEQQSGYFFIWLHCILFFISNILIILSLIQSHKTNSIYLKSKS